MAEITRQKVLLFLALLIICVLAISAGLPLVDLQPGQPLPGSGKADAAAAPGAISPAPAASSPVFFKATIGFLFILFIPLLVYGLVKSSPWRQIIRYMTLITILSVAALSLLALLSSQYGGVVEQAADPIALSTKAPAATTPLGSPPGWLVWLVFSTLAVLVGSAGLWLIYHTSRGDQKKDRVAEEAEKAVDALRAGMDLKDVIVRCYLQMSLALQQDQGIERKEAMTTREFERLLEARGVPHDPVHDLTRLFESVRYGRRQAGPRDEQAAFDCLSAIIQYSRAGGQPR